MNLLFTGFTLNYLLESIKFTAYLLCGRLLSIGCPQNCQFRVFLMFLEVKLTL